MTRKRMFRFSLRTMLLLLSVGAVFFGWQVSQIRRQQVAVANIEESGGQVRFLRSKEGELLLRGPGWLHRMMGDDGFRTVHSVVLFAESNSEFADDLSDLPDLQELQISGDNLSRETLTAVTRLSELRILGLCSFDNSHVTDEWMPKFAKLKHLMMLDVRGAPVSDDGLRHLCNLSQLRTLLLAETKVTDAGLEHLTQLKQLSVLDFGSLPITDRGLRALRPHAKLRDLSLHGTRITNEGLVHLKSLPSLTTIGLGRTSINDAGLKVLAQIPTLNRISLERTSITDEGLQHLQSLPLQHLSLYGTTITDEAVDRLQQATPRRFQYQKSIDGWNKKQKP